MELLTSIAFRKMLSRALVLVFLFPKDMQPDLLKGEHRIFRRDSPIPQLKGVSYRYLLAVFEYLQD
jgi:hypothetical protein